MKVLVVDDHALVRDALSRVVSALVPDATVVLASDGRAGLDVVDRERDVDLVLLDLSLPHVDGMAALRVLRQRHPAVSVVVVSATSDAHSVKQALDAGASGFVPKSSSNEVLKSALGVVLAGGVYVPPEVLHEHGPAVGPQRHATSKLGLTTRQGQILALMMRGHSNKVICRELDLAESTVKNQVTAILRTLGVRSRTQAVLEATRLGFHAPAARLDADR